MFANRVALTTTRWLGTGTNHHPRSLKGNMGSMRPQIFPMYLRLLYTLRNLLVVTALPLVAVRPPSRCGVRAEKRMKTVSVRM